MSRRVVVGGWAGLALAVGVAWFAQALAAAAPGPGPAGGASPGVASFQPKGTAHAPRQVTARFRTDMVALGDPNLAAPFTVDCPVPGTGHWLDTRTWIYDFDTELDAGVRCTFSVRAGLAALDGRPLPPVREEFDTGAPAVVRTLPAVDGPIDESQAFILKFDGEPVLASLEGNAWCAVDGLADRVPFQLLAGAERERVLAQRARLGYEYFQLFYKDGSEGFARVRSRAMEKSAARLLVVGRCARTLPPGAKVQLTIGTGVRSVAGIASSEAQQLGYVVRPAFEVRMECERANADSGCLPMRPIRAVFSSAVPRERLKGLVLRDASGTQYPADPLPAAPVAEAVQFSGPFPESAAMTLVLPKDLRDDAGRTAVNAARFPLPFQLAPYPPLAKFSGDFGIVELKEGGVLPVTLRALEPGVAASAVRLEGRTLRLGADAAAILHWIGAVAEAGRERGEAVRLPKGAQANGALKPKLEDVDELGDDGTTNAAGEVLSWRNDTGTASVFSATDAPAALELPRVETGHATEVVGIPLGKPGFYVVEIASRVLGSALLGRDQVRYVASSALVTDLAVHFKWGRESSLVWVTRLHDGSVVPGAEVQVADGCEGDTLWKGRTGDDGVARIDQSMGDPGNLGSCQYGTHPLVALARLGDDFSFTLSTWNQGITPYQFNLATATSREAGIYHTVLDRALYRAGETVSMKHFLRRHDSHGIAAFGPGAPGHATIIHQGSGQHYDVPVDFGTDGIATTTWKIPPEAKLGTYDIQLDGHESGSFKVGEFRLPLMHGSVTGPAGTQVAPASVPLDLHVAWQSGGGAAGLAARLRTVVEPREVQFPGYDGWDFTDTPVAVGQRSRQGTPWDWDPEQAAGEGDEAPDAPRAPAQRVRTQPVTLDRGGSARVVVDGLGPVGAAAQLTAELEYDDPNGERQTVTSRVRLAPADLVLGIRREGWLASRDQLRFQVVALDADGHPRAGLPVVVRTYTHETYSFRRRLVGGFYAYDSVEDTQPAKASCSGTTDAQGRITCDMAPGVSGNLLLRAEARDPAGRVAGATSSAWIAGDEEQWFGGTSGDRMDLLPEQREVEPGQVARLQVRMPFRSATALVTVEREGVLRSYVRTLSGKDPVVEVPIEAADSPNAYVSVLALRGRIAHAEDPAAARRAGGEVTGLVDLTRPAYRLGEVNLRVGWAPHRLAVTVATDRAQYRVREQAIARVHVAAPGGAPLPAGAEVALAAVDESLLDLAPNGSWKLLEAMMGERGIEVYTATAQTQVIGRRHYGRKAVAHGGGGGREHARELFDSLLAWAPRVALDAHGDATVKVPLNDTLGAFRIVAIAHAGSGLFGTGDARITSTQDLQLLSGLPPLVRAGDKFAATFTVRNTTAAPLAVHLAVDGALAPIDVDVPAGSARDVSWQVTAPLDKPKLAWDVTATAGAATDRLKLVQQVVPAVPVRTYQAVLEQLRSPLTLPVSPPAAALPGRGGVQLHLQARLAGSLDGVREFMQRYPWSCLEQQVSRAIVLGDDAAWDSIVERLPAYLDGDGLARYFPTDRLEGDEVLTAYVLDIASESGRELADGARGRMLEGLRRFVGGRLARPAAMDRADITIRRLAAIEALSRYDAATPDMLEPLRLQVRELPSSALLDWASILRRMPALPRAAERQAAIHDELRGRLDLRGTTLNFSTERRDALWWLMIDGDVNANRLVLEGLSWPGWDDELPKMVRGTLGRQDAGHWNTTVANAWGMLAMQAFSARFESQPVGGETRVAYGTDSRALAWPKGVDPQPAAIPWQAAGTPLTITHAGGGAPWAMLRFQAALPLQRPDFNGLRVVRTLAPLEQAVPGQWTRGDVVRVHLDMEAQSDLGWVAIEDPIPAGSAILGGGLGNESALLQKGEQRTGWAWPAFEERRFEGYRAYYRFVPKGSWSLDYTVRLGNAGTFQLPATRVEAMYAPETYAESPNAPFVVKPAP